MGVEKDEVWILYGSKGKTQFKWTRILRAQNNELLVSGQNIAFSSKRSLLRMSETEN